MKVVVTFDLDEKNLDDLVVMAKVYRKKDGYKEFVSVENNLPLKPLPEKINVKVEKIEDIMHTEFQTMDVITDKFIADIRFETDKLVALGWNACLENIMGNNKDEV